MRKESSDRYLRHIVKQFHIQATQVPEEKKKNKSKQSLIWWYLPTQTFQSKTNIKQNKLKEKHIQAPHS